MLQLGFVDGVDAACAHAESAAARLRPEEPLHDALAIGVRGHAVAVTFRNVRFDRCSRASSTRRSGNDPATPAAPACHPATLRGLRFSASEVAEILETTVAAVNSGLQRARAQVSNARVEPDDVLEPTAPERPRIDCRPLAAMRGYA